MEKRPRSAPHTSKRWPAAEQEGGGRTAPPRSTAGSLDDPSDRLDRLRAVQGRRFVPRGPLLIPWRPWRPWRQPEDPPLDCSGSW